MLAAAKSPPKLITLIVLTAVSILSLNMFLPSLPNIASGLQADYGLVNLSIAGYLAITAVLQIVLGPLSDRFGRRPVLLVSIALFAAASLGCALANDIWTFLFFRVLQGAIISGMALSRAVIRDMVPPQEAASLLGYVSMAMAVAPMLGPLFGGVLDEFFGWRASFYAFMAMGIALYWLCWVDLGETNTAPSETFTAQFQTYPELFRSRRFWGYAFCMAFSVGAFYAFLAGAPLVAERLFAMSPAMLGLCLGTISLGFAFGSFLSGRLARRYSLLTLIIWGRVVACIGLAGGLMLFALGFVNAITLFGATIFVGLGNGLTLPSANAGAMSVRPHLAGSASGLSGAMTVGGGALLTWATGLVITETNGAYALVGMMLFSSFAGLVSALYVWRIDVQEAQGTTVQPE